MRVSKRVHALIAQPWVSATTYSYCRKDILKFVHEGNQPRVVHVDPTYTISYLLASYEGLSRDMCVRIRIRRHGGRGR